MASLPEASLWLLCPKEKMGRKKSRLYALKTLAEKRLTNRMVSIDLLIILVPVEPGYP